MYGETFTGEGTYYDYTTGGNCAYGGDVLDMWKNMIPSEWREYRWKVGGTVDPVCIYFLWYRGCRVFSLLNRQEFVNYLGEQKSQVARPMSSFSLAINR